MFGALALSLLLLGSQDTTDDPLRVQGVGADYSACSPPALPADHTVVVPFEPFDARTSVAQVLDLHQYHSGRRDVRFSERMNDRNRAVRALFADYSRRLRAAYETHRIQRRARFTITSSSGRRDEHFRLYPPPGYAFLTETWGWEGNGLHNHWERPDEIAIHIRGQHVEGWVTIQATMPRAQIDGLAEGCLEAIRTELTRLNLPTDRTPDFPASVDDAPAG